MAQFEAQNVDQGISRLRLQTLLRLRWVAVAGQLAALLIVYLGFGFELPFGFCLAFIAISAWLNILLRIRYPARHRLSIRFATSMLAYDLLQLVGLLFLTGGIENPFSVLIAAPVMVSAASLPWRSTAALGLLATLAVLGLVAVHWPLPWTESGNFRLPVLYKAGMAASVLATMLFLALYAARLSKEASQMSEALAATEFVLAREQKLHALDGLAAAAAHELGTPLSTITLVAKELERELPAGSPLAEDAALLKSQADRCREILNKLRQSPSESDPLHARLAVSKLLDEAAEPYRDFDTEILVSAEPDAHVAGDAAAEPVMLRRPGVVYGLGNIIENAADFAKSRVDVMARWDQERIVCTITDDGTGFAPNIIDRLGEPYVTTRAAEDRDPADDEAAAGLGLGFFIAKTLLERSGATVEVSNRVEPETGAMVRITWPRWVFEEAKDALVWANRNEPDTRTLSAPADV